MYDYDESIGGNWMRTPMYIPDRGISPILRMETYRKREEQELFQVYGLLHLLAPNYSFVDMAEKEI